jgi:hypothetical protein
MRLFPAFLLLALPLGAAEPNTLTAEERAAGWRLLFDGRTAAGWLEVTGKPFPASWVVEDGCLRALEVGSKQDLRTEAVYRYFELSFEWKIEAKGNSGVKYLVQKTDEWTNATGRQARARGLEYQIFDDAGAALKPEQNCGALYGVRAPSARPARPPGQFNESRIVVRRGRIEHWLNGLKVVESVTPDPEISAMLSRYADGGAVKDETYLSLQNHGGLARFRNLKLRVLPE